MQDVVEKCIQTAVIKPDGKSPPGKLTTTDTNQSENRLYKLAVGGVVSSQLEQ
jgi:hypothetical protein